MTHGSVTSANILSHKPEEVCDEFAVCSGGDGSGEVPGGGVEEDPGGVVRGRG